MNIGGLKLAKPTLHLGSLSLERIQSEFQNLQVFLLRFFVGLPDFPQFSFPNI